MNFSKKCAGGARKEGRGTRYTTGPTTIIGTARQKESSLQNPLKGDDSWLSRRNRWSRSWM